MRQRNTPNRRAAGALALACLTLAALGGALLCWEPFRGFLTFWGYVIALLLA